MNQSASYSEIEMSVVVPADSSISDVTELSSVQAPTNADGSNIDALISQIKSDKGVDLATETVDSYQAAYENLINGSSQAMVLNSAYSSLLELSYDDYESNQISMVHMVVTVGTVVMVIMEKVKKKQKLVEVNEKNS